MNNLLGKTYQLKIGQVKIIEVKNDVVYMQNINNEKDKRETSVLMFKMMIQNGIIMEIK